MVMALPAAVSSTEKPFIAAALAWLTRLPLSTSVTAWLSETNTDPLGADAVKFGVLIKSGFVQAPTPAVPADESVIDDVAPLVLSVPDD